MADLPAHRVAKSLPFEIIGTDLMVTSESSKKGRLYF